MSRREPLTDKWKEIFQKFVSHFEDEYKVIQDEKLDRELKQLLDFLKEDQQVPQVHSQSQFVFG